MDDLRCSAAGFSGTTEESCENFRTSAVVAHPVVIGAAMPAALHAIDEVGRLFLQTGCAERTCVEAGRDRSGIPAARTQLPLTCARIADRLTGIGSNVDQAQIATS